ncbi:MAG: hypothetical protein Tsb006_6510 [Rickettsiaceae bacterium]
MIMKLKLYLIFILAFALMGCALQPHEKLYKKKPGFYSYIIGDIKNSNIDKEYASEVYATPASCQKVITTLVALKALGPEYRYETKLFVRQRHNIARDIIISFSGDPTLDSEQLIELLKPLKDHKIHGQIILDASVFSTPPYSPNIMIGDVGTGYSPPVSSINIDKNLIVLKVSAQKIGEAAEIDTHDDYKINANIITNNSPSSIKLAWNGDVIHMEGNINQQDSPIELKLSPKEIDQYTISKVKAVLKRLNISGKIKLVHDKFQVPSSFKLVNKIDSSWLGDIIRPALKASDNLVFDSIYLTMLHAYSPEKVTSWEQGNSIIRDLINKHFAVEVNDALFVDGSGLSRYNRVQPKVLISLLRKGFSMPEFVDSLPRPGEEDSTLKNRTKLPSNIIVKTGNMSGISCLCGYSLYPLGRQKVFVFMANSFAPPSKEMFDVMDSFISSQL